MSLIRQRLVPGPGGLWVTYGEGVYCSPGPKEAATLVYDHDTRVTALASAPHRGWVASGDQKGEILVYDVHTRRIIAVMRAWGGWVADLCWDLETELLASVCVAGDRSCATEQWQLPGERLALLLGWGVPEEAIWAPDHHAIAWQDESWRTQVLAWSAGERILTPQKAQRLSVYMAWSPDSQWLAGAWDDHIEVWEPATGAVWGKGRTHGVITGITWTDEATLVTAETPNDSPLAIQSEWLRPWRQGSSGMLEAGKALHLDHNATRGGHDV